LGSEDEDGDGRDEVEVRGVWPLDCPDMAYLKVRMVIGG